ncbi:hypothetical protein CSC28_1246 [Pseudomonas paraeruginosa]|nr:hypothetical protein CSC28_1246 [Pseudomonas paraeruginosa]
MICVTSAPPHGEQARGQARVTGAAKTRQCPQERRLSD